MTQQTNANDKHPLNLSCDTKIRLIPYSHTDQYISYASNETTKGHYAMNGESQQLQDSTYPHRSTFNYITSCLASNSSDFKNDDKQIISLQSTKFDDHYIRHSCTRLWLCKNDETDLFKQEASFIIHSPALNNKASHVSFECVNQLNKGYYIRLRADNTLYIEKKSENEQNNGWLDAVSFKIEEIKLTILSALYGSNNRYINVTEKIRNEIDEKQQSLTIPPNYTLTSTSQVYNDICHDPDCGVVRDLQVVWRYADLQNSAIRYAANISDINLMATVRIKEYFTYFSDVR